MGRYTVEVGLCLVRPPREHRLSRVILEGCCALHAELDAMLVAAGVHHAVMAVSSVVTDWPEEETPCTSTRPLSSA